jgi:hypothetical protein
MPSVLTAARCSSRCAGTADRNEPLDWVRRRWVAFWFAPDSGLDLSVARVAFFGGLLAIHGAHDFSTLGEVSPVLWEPVSVFQWLPQPAAWVIQAAQIVWRLALLCAAAGLETRAATAVAFVGGAFLLGLPQNLGAIRLDDTMVVPALSVMAMARCGDRLSVDRWLATRRTRMVGPSFPLRPSGEYTWPIRLVWVLMAMMYGGSGFAKLRMAGVSWLTSDHIARLLLQQHYGVEPPPLGAWGLTIAASPYLHHGLAAASVGIELAFPLALLSARARCLIVPAAYLMHVGIRLLFGANFLGLIALYAFWVPWERLATLAGADWLPTARSGAPQS